MDFLLAAADYLLSSFTQFKEWLFRKPFSGYYKFTIPLYAKKVNWRTQENRSFFSRLLDYIAYGSSSFYAPYVCTTDITDGWNHDYLTSLYIYDGVLLNLPMVSKHDFKLKDEQNIQSVWFICGQDTYIDITDSVRYLLKKNNGLIIPKYFISWILEVNGIKLVNPDIDNEQMEMTLEVKYLPKFPNNPFSRPKPDFIVWNLATKPVLPKEI